MRKIINEKDLVGYKIGIIEVIGIGYLSDKGVRMMECKCHRCGNIFYQTKYNIACRLKGCSCKKCKNQNLITHGMKNTKIYALWRDMKHRCNSDNDNCSRHYRIYFSRGIRVCDEWSKNFMSFYKWAINNGWNEDNLYSSGRNMLTVDRIDNDKGYSPENCRIVTHKENQRNKRNTIRVSYQNKIYTIPELAEMFNINSGALYHRIKSGWKEEDWNKPVERSK